MAVTSAINEEQLNEVLDQINSELDAGVDENQLTLDSDMTIEINDEHEAMDKLCKAQARIEKISDFLNKLPNYIDFINKIDLRFYNNLDVDLTPIKNKIELLSLKIKRITLITKIKLTKLKRNLLMLAAQGKIAGVLQAVFSAILIALQAIFLAIAVILAIIEKVLMMMPSMMSVEGEGMAFFITPKSLKATKMVILNPNQSVERVLPTPVIKSIDTILNTPIITMTENKKTAMAKSISLSSAAAIMNINNSGVDPISVVDGNFSYTARNILITTISTLLALLPLVEPLPKYERLPI